MGIRFFADNEHFHCVVYLLISLQRRQKKTEAEETCNVVLVILLEINQDSGQTGRHLGCANRKKEPEAQPRSQGSLPFSFLEVEKPLEQGCQGQGFCELFALQFFFTL